MNVTNLKKKKIILAYPLHNNNNGYIRVNWIDTLEGLSKKYDFEFSSVDFLKYKTQFGSLDGTKRFVDDIISIKPDILISHITADHFVPDSLYRLREANIKTINMFFEGAHCFHNCVTSLVKCFDYWTDTYLPGLCRYEQLGTKVIYLPLGVNLGFVARAKIKKYEERDIDVSFVGSCYHFSRNDILKRVYDLGVKLCVCGNYWEDLSRVCQGCVRSVKTISQELMYDIYGDSKIVINFSDIGNTRTLRGRDFEATACGALLITGKFSAIEGLFTSDEVVFYEGENEIPEIVKEVLSNQKKYSKIAENGQNRTLKEHTWQNRFMYLFKETGIL